VFIPQPRAYSNLLPKKDDSHCLAACGELDKLDQRITVPDENDVDGYEIPSWVVFLLILESRSWQVNQKIFAVIVTAQRILHQTTPQISLLDIRTPRSRIFKRAAANPPLMQH
jgi:hypothetical protein